MGRDQKIQLRELGDVEDIWQKFLLPGDMQGQLRFIDQDEAAFRHIKEQLVEQDQLMLFPRGELIQWECISRLGQDLIARLHIQLHLFGGELFIDRLDQALSLLHHPLKRLELGLSIFQDDLEDIGLLIGEIFFIHRLGELRKQAEGLELCFLLIQCSIAGLQQRKFRSFSALKEPTG